MELKLNKYQCNKCGAVFKIFFKDTHYVNYCPNCGVARYIDNVTYKGEYTLEGNFVYGLGGIK